MPVRADERSPPFLGRDTTLGLKLVEGSVMTDITALEPLVPP
jgi:hypothetical protein